MLLVTFEMNFIYSDRYEKLTGMDLWENEEKGFGGSKHRLLCLGRKWRHTYMLGYELKWFSKDWRFRPLVFIFLEKWAWRYGRRSLDFWEERRKYEIATKENGPGSTKESHEFSDHKFEACSVNEVACVSSDKSCSTVADTKMESWVYLRWN